MHLFILSLVTLFTFGVSAQQKTTFFPGENLKDFSYYCGGVHTFLPHYKYSKSISWLLIPKGSVGQRHFISNRNAIDYSLSASANLDIQHAEAEASYLFYPMPAYGFYLGVGLNINEIYYFDVPAKSFFYWTEYHGIAGLQFKLNDETPVFVQVKYTKNGILSVLYGVSF